MTDPAIPPEVEEIVGAWVGVAAVFMVQGFNERVQKGSLTAETRQQGGKVLARLVEVRLDGYTVENLEHAAFLHAPDTIRQCCNTLDANQINGLITNVLEIVARVVKKEAH